VTAARSGARPLPSDSRTPEQILRQRERSASIRAAFARLDSRERRILQLCYVEERSIPEIATALGVSPTRIFQLKRRALDRLALQLAPLRAAA
jgi:RNA polymerase sigma factor for flagellar operon FliA